VTEGAGASSMFSADDMPGRTVMRKFGESRMDGRNRADIKAGAHVLIVRKQDQRSGKLTEGSVKDVLTKSPTHPHGIKVRLESGVVGRVKKILSEDS
jgi:uncharacterized repeat protein (TIGR03833 family)